jgi:Cu/Ag efflux pump CusA
MPDPARMQRAGRRALTQVEQALRTSAPTPAAASRPAQGREYLIRHIGRSRRIEDLQGWWWRRRNGQPILLQQVADGETRAGHQARRRGLQGQAGGDPVGAEAAGADSVKLTRAVERRWPSWQGLPRGLETPPRVLFKQADFIEHLGRQRERPARRRHPGGGRAVRCSC